MTTYFRIQSAKRNPEKLVGRHHVSRLWVGEAWLRCNDCDGMGTDRDGYTCGVCRGEGRVEDVRRGVSVCRSIEDLTSYFADRGANLDGDHVVELEGDESEDEDYDAGSAGDPILVHPTRIVAIHPISVLGEVE